jgi:LysR family hydrogen peroxide-inducible transcriptional activator
VQMVDNGLGVTFVPAMAIEAGILEGTRVEARPLKSEHGFRRVALIWRRSSPREEEFQLLAETLRDIAREVIPGLGSGVTITASRGDYSRPNSQRSSATAFTRA